jgi:Heterokaryon incompatibility protein (HET)
VDEWWNGLSGPEDLPGVDDLLGSFRWYDALCINQQDVKERNHQVNQMGKIYESATNVVVWLGLLDSTSSLAVKFLLETGVGNLADTRYNMFCQGDTRTFIEEDTLEAISVLCRRRYWFRLWIIQEIILARSISLHVGNDYCDGLDLAFFIRQLEAHVVVKSESLLHKKRMQTMRRVI